ncbi:MAG: tetratricopeptide repeat protein [Ardenticatenaceae bacterium]|nr:tetratricopeptide repeat protein [Ardenticatenaceae bacterium]MCB9444681.1 tetratricopeptide repeat protein [Ardenticatenaceae bacterium]
MGAAKQSDSAGLYFDQLRLALNNFHDPRWLGRESPLAAPYFLGTALTGGEAGHTAEGRGRALQQVIHQAADSLWGGPLPISRQELETAVQEARQEEGNSGSRYHFLLLDLRYLRRYFRPRANPPADSEQAIRDYLGVGRGPYFNHIKAARGALGEALINLLQPTFRLERPPQFEGQLIGREPLINQCWQELQKQRTVAITGMGGAGKTALAAAVATAWSQSPVFWFTFWPTLNDQLSSLLFSLGYFLHQQGESGLWLQLVADHGQADNRHLALEQVRGALHALDPKPLLCIDEVDRLITDPEKVTPDQQQLLAFLESLRGLAPVILIGQQVNILTDAHFTPAGLTPEQVQTFLVQNNVAHTASDVQRLQTITGGNARMIWLCVALARNGRSLDEILIGLPKTAVFQTLFARFWQSLAPDERHFLQQIAVFRSPAPTDAFPQATAVLDSLATRHILQRDGPGAISLLPIVRDLVYEDHQRLPAEAREQAHLAAAGIRAERGEYTAAAHHFFHGGETAAAVQVWYPYREQEIKRGQGAAALAFFEQLSSRHLPEAEAQALALIRGELYQLVGQTEQGLAELTAVKWREDSETAVQAHLLQGTFLNSLGYPQNALKKLDDGLAVITRLQQQLVRYRQRRAVIHIQQWQMQDAVQEARLAQYTTENLQGQIHEQQGNYDEAYLAYQRALLLARSIGHEAGVAQTNREITNLLIHQSRLDEAQQHLQAALDYYDAIGDRLNWEKARSSLVGIHFQAGEFEQVIAIGQQSLPFFEQAKIPYYAGVIASNIAESYYEIGNLAQAEFYARKTLSFEETHPYPYALYTLGLIRRAQGDFAAAEGFLRQSQEVAASNSDSFMEAYALRLLGEVLAEKGDRETAVSTLHQALNLFQRLNIRSEIDKIQNMLAKMG